MRSWTAIPRSMKAICSTMALGGLAVVGACADGSLSQKLTAPESPAFSSSMASPGVVEICVDPASPAGIYTFAVTNGTNIVPATDVVTNPVVIDTNVSNCGNAFVRTGAPASNLTFATVTVTATAPAGGSVSYVCIDDVAVGDPFCNGNTAGTTTGDFSASSAHGSVVTFLFVAPPPPPAGCTFTQGYYKNKGNALIAGNTNFDGSGLSETEILNTPSGGNGYIILAKQYIAAKANIAGGAGITGDALIAYNAATAYFATGLTIANPYDATYTKNVLTALGAALDLYNNGVAGQGNPLHCD